MAFVFVTSESQILDKFIIKVKKNIMKRADASSKKSKTSKSTSEQPSPSAVIAALKTSSRYVLNILKETETNQTSPQAPIEAKLPLAPRKRLLTENVPVPDRRLEPTIVRKAYSVFWAKKSSRKLNKWDGDGVLEVIGRCGLVKNEEGTRVGQMCNLKPDLIVPGLILPAGRVDIEIKELIPAGSQKVISTRRIFPEQQHGPKRTRYSQPHVLANLLVMPKPSKEHGWIFNTKNARVNDVTVTYCLAKVLRPHQRLGVTFMYGCVTGIYQINRMGAILADEKGMGKTLQCITLIWTLLHQGPYGGTPIIKKALIVTPTNLTEVWEKEFYRWLGRSRIRVFVAHARKQFEFSTAPHPVYIISYEMFVRCYEAVSHLSFDLIICDEGHRLKNALNRATTLLGQLPCKRRIILTATAIEKELQEFFVLTDFVNPGCLGTNEQYTQYFVIPILKSREPTADQHVKALGNARAAELNEITNGFILRRSHGITGAYLPTKTETVVFCKSSQLQQDLYVAAVEAWDNRNITNNYDLSHLSVMMILKKICNHPSLIMRDVNESRDLFPGSLRSLLSPDSPMKLEESGKVKVLLNLLQRVAANDEKIVLVSSYTQTLGMLANLCEVRDYKYVRLDGTISANNRLSIVTSFNNPWSKILVFLLSAKAGGLGLNLSGASRLVLFDSDWNPATDLQAMSRIWRDGQKYSVYLYRFLTTGTIEEKIYQRQVSKTALSGTVVDAANTSSIRLSEEELTEAFNYDFDDDCATHSLLNCKCKCDGSVPESAIVKEVTGRDPQFDRPSTRENSPAVKMNQLMKWEHHKPPYEGKNVDELLLSDSYSDISFMFRDHKC
ncbi:okra [Carabus blaptoides fortunei]